MLSSRVSVLSGSKSLVPPVDCIMVAATHPNTRDTGSRKGDSWSGLWEQLKEQTVSVCTTMLPRGNELINYSLECVCRGESPAAVKIICYFSFLIYVYIYLLFKNGARD